MLGISDYHLNVATVYILVRRSTVYRSNVIRSDLYPTWDEVLLSLEAACNGDLQRAMKVVVWDYRRGGRHKSMGEFETTMGQILDAASTDGANFFTLWRHDQDVGKISVIKADLTRRKPEQKTYEKSRAEQESKPEPKPKPKLEPKPEPKISEKPPPDLPRAPSGGIPLSINVSPRPEFVDYLSGGCEINLAVAIDFTASNGMLRCTLWHFVCQKLGKSCARSLERMFYRGPTNARHSSLLSCTGV